jgi:hypothetical protein
MTSGHAARERIDAELGATSAGKRWYVLADYWTGLRR